MLILLPPSEGKTAPRRGKPLDLGSLTSPSLTAARTTLLESLVQRRHYEPGALQGILFCRAQTAEEVRGWFEKDPVIVAGARTIDVREALPMSVGVEPAAGVARHPE